MNCKFCNKTFSNYKSHNAHIAWCINNPDKKIRYSAPRKHKNRIKQNKYDWDAIQNYYDAGNSLRDIHNKFGCAFSSIIKARNRGQLKLRSKKEAVKYRIAKYGTPVLSTEQKRAISIRMSKNNNGGKSKWFSINGQKVQGTWEFNIATILNELNIAWDRKNISPWKYVLDKKEKHYTPDFYLPEYDCYLEIKGYWWHDDKNKMKCVIEQYPDRTIHIIEELEYTNILKTKKFTFLCQLS